jgi:hypothetical protein
MKGDSRQRRWNMLESTRATRIWQDGIRMAAILAGAGVPSAFAKAAGHSTTVAGIKATVDCVSESALHVAATIGQTLWVTMDACLVSQAVRAAGMLLAPDSAFNPVHAVVGIIGHELVGHAVSFVFHLVSGL